ncbi:LacI family DNA-binding transcriptional regulator [Nonomuraea zeae]|uniref:LacI family transcriptional regulator n=1 Tax=Nonomuraea zeae TaxID=1642303 RepID=A0A5S4FAI4_9ACTN|nr:LacI family DNA-binding transcriptional regulator [Nonomuraea zeae]TMR14378.1 LacI family transcriptional regulator [Nonomuraea zeae]
MRRNADQPTIDDVAALAGVSRSAVSKVMNGRGGISPKTATAVREAAAKLKWVPSATAVALRGSRTRSVGMVIARSTDLLATDPYFAVMISGAEQVLAPRGYGLQLHLMGDDPEAESATYRKLVRERRVDGFLLTESRIGDPRFALLRELDRPAVLIGIPWRDDPQPHVQSADPLRGMLDAARHLLDLGHRRVAYVSGPDDRVHTVQRRETFVEAMRAAGVTPATVAARRFDSLEARTITEELLRRPDRPTAIVYANDMMALAGMGAAQRAGIDVPGGLSVVGHDDLPIGAWHYPALTSVAQDLASLGAAAALTLLRLLGEEPPGPIPDIPPTRLIVRESTAKATHQ